MLETSTRMTGRLFFGLVVIALGVIFTLDNLGFLSAAHILRWWPTLLLAYGAARLTGFQSRQNIAAGVLFTLIGAWMLLHNIGILHYGLWDLWPVILIALGLSMVTGSLGRWRRGAEADDVSPRFSGFAFMSGAEHRVAARDFKGGEVTAIMGGQEIDLRGAKIAGNSATIDLFVWWGGVDIRVPEDWAVSCEALPLMGGIEDHSRAPGGEPKGHLILKGLVVMGGVEIKN